MIDRLEAMSILRLAVEKGSLTAAAKALRMPLPTVSRKVSELEAHVGARLLIRTTRKLTLTDAGEGYLAAARSILEQVETAERAAAGEFVTPSGELILSAPVVFGRLHLMPIIADFLAAFPQVSVRLLLSDRNVHLIEDHVDMAVRIGRLPDSGLIATRIGIMRQVVCSSPSFLAAHGTPRTPNDLTRLPCVTFDFEGPQAVWAFPKAGRRAGIETPIRPRLSVSNADAALWAAERGIGITRLLHYHCADAVKRGALQLLLTAFEPEPLPVHVLHAPRGRLPLKMRAFLDFATPKLRVALEGL